MHFSTRTEILKADNPMPLKAVSAAALCTIFYENGGANLSLATRGAENLLLRQGMSK